jgi:hypothetical protein
VHQRPDPEGRPDRRLSSAVECMVAITNFGATGGGAGKFQHGRLRIGPKIGKNVEAFGQHAGRGDARSRSSTFLRVSGTVGALRPMAGQPSRRRGRPNLKGLWRAPWRCHRSGSYFVRPCLHRQRASAEAGSPGPAALSGTKYSNLGQRISPKTRGRADGEMEGR